jgi:hypothetical protein
MGLLSENCKRQSGFRIHRVAGSRRFDTVAIGCGKRCSRLQNHRDVKLVAFLFLRKLFSASAWESAVFPFSLWQRLLLLRRLLGCVPGTDLLTNFFPLLRRQQLENLTALHTLVPFQHRISLIRG